MGTQVILHRLDTDTVEQRDQTRNLGLQSIVNRENTLVGEAINTASNYRNAIKQLNALLEELNQTLALYTRIATLIYRLMSNAYHSTSKTQKLITISNEGVAQIGR